MSGKITASSHLPAEQLRAFQSGTLPEEHIAEVEAHLQICVACCEVLSGLPEDNFLLRVRCACENPPTLLQQSPSFTPPPPDSVTLSDTPLETMAGDRPSLPGYEGLRELGRGGMGVVYAATHVVMGRRVAIKVIHPEFSSNPVAAARFRREVLAAARLSHPNIVTAYDAGEDGGRSFLVMERVDGESLGDRLNRFGPLPVAEACDTVRQAALGVQHAHDNGLIHRDLKPHNLMCTADGLVKVCDFGLAALVGDRRPAGSTAPNAIMGTPDYMAPEQAEDARAADGRADVYALGCTLYHLLTGRVPFPEDSVLLKLVAHRTQTRPSAGRLRPEIPPELDDVLRRAMARKPANRYQTPGDFAKALEPFADPGQYPPRQHGRKRLLVLAALILCLGAAIAGLVRLPMSKEQEAVIQTDDREVEPEQPGEVLRWSQGYKYVPRNVVSPDGRFAWTAGDDFSKWDLSTGKRLEQIGARGFAEEVLPSPDGKMLLLAQAGAGGAQLYNAATLKPLRSLVGNPSRLMQAVWLPDGRLLTGGNDFIARLWDAQTGKVIREFRGHTANVDYVDVNRDGTRILTFSCGEGTVRVWNPDDGKELWSLSGHTGLALFAPDGRSILIGGSDGVIRLVAFPSRTVLRYFRSPARQPISWDRLCLMADGKHFLSAGSDGTLRLWELATGREIYRVNHSGLATSLAATPDGRFALLGTNFGSVLKWRLSFPRPGGEPIAEDSRRAEEVGETGILGSESGKIGRVHFLPDGEHVLASGDSLTLWNTRTGKMIQEFTGELRGWSLPVNVSRDGRYALAGLHLLDLKTGTKVRTLEGSEDSRAPLWGVALSPDASRAVLGGDLGRRTGTLWVADLETGKPWKIYDTERRVRAVAYSPDGTCIAAGHARPGTPDTLRVYKVETGAILHSFDVPKEPGCMAFSPDGNQLVSGHDRILCLWDLKLGKPLKRFEGHTGFIEDVVFTPDGQHIVSAGWDATVRVWSVVSGEEIACFRGHTEGILGVSVSPDGLHAVSGSGDRTLRLWRLPKQKSGSGVSPTTLAVSAFREIHGVDADAFIAWAGAQAREGFRPVFLSTEVGSAKPRFNGIVLRDGRALPNWVQLKLSPSEARDLFLAKTGQGYRPLVSCLYDDQGQQRQAHIYVKDGVNFGGYGTDWAKVREVLDKHGRKAWMTPIYLSATPGRGPEQLTVIMAPDYGRAWQEHLDLNAEQLHRLTLEQRSKGWRLTLLNAYQNENGKVRFLAVFAENDDHLDWECRAGLTSGKYERMLAEQDRLGLRPVAVASYREAGEVHYAAAWVRYRTAK